MTILCWHCVQCSNNIIRLEQQSQQLHNAQQIVTISSIALTLSLEVQIIKLMGSVDSKMVYFCLATPITLSTWIQT